MKPPVNKISVSTTVTRSGPTPLSFLLAALIAIAAGTALWLYHYQPKWHLLEATDLRTAELLFGGGVLYCLWWLADTALAARDNK